MPRYVYTGRPSLSIPGSSMNTEIQEYSNLYIWGHSTVQTRQSCALVESRGVSEALRGHRRPPAAFAGLRMPICSENVLLPVIRENQKWHLYALLGTLRPGFFPQTRRWAECSLRMLIISSSLLKLCNIHSDALVTQEQSTTTTGQHRSTLSHIICSCHLAVFSIYVPTLPDSSKDNDQIYDSLPEQIEIYHPIHNVFALVVLAGA